MPGAAGRRPRGTLRVAGELPAVPTHVRVEEYLMLDLRHQPLHSLLLRLQPLHLIVVLGLHPF